MANKKKNEDLYCVCRGVSEGDMVACDYCDEWFHLKCIELKKKDIKNIKHYKCAKCVKLKRKTLLKGSKSDESDSDSSDSDESLLLDNNKGRVRWINSKSGKPIPTKPTLSISALATLPSPPATASIPLSPPACAPLPVPFAPANSPSSPTMSQKPMLDIRKRVVSQLKELIPEPTAMEIEQHMFTHVRRNWLSKYFAILKRNNVLKHGFLVYQCKFEASPEYRLKFRDFLVALKDKANDLPRRVIFYYRSLFFFKFIVFKIAIIWIYFL